MKKKINFLLKLKMFSLQLVHLIIKKSINNEFKKLLRAFYLEKIMLHNSVIDSIISNSISEWD